MPGVFVVYYYLDKFDTLIRSAYRQAGEKMNDWKNGVLIGNLAISPHVLRQFLKKSCYFMTYDPDKETILFCANDGGGGQNILEIHNASHENAVKLAVGLGLEDNRDNHKLDEVCHWSKWNPKLELGYDDSPEAEELKIEILRFGIPHRIIKSKETYFLIYHISGVSYRMESPSYSKQQMVSKIREVAIDNSTTLSSTP